MCLHALNLGIKCLSFDFIGTNPDESAEDVGAVQVPSSWRMVVQQPATMQLLFDMYATLQGATAARCIEMLTLLASVRRSMFSDDTERKRFLKQLMLGIRQVLQTQQGLDDADSYHEFCRLLGRLKSNYQLSELVRTDGYQEWIDLVAKFTINSFQQWQWSSNSMHYLLGLWARLVVAIPYVKPDVQGQSNVMLDAYIPQLVRAFVQSRLDAVVDAVSSDSLEDLFEESNDLQEQLERLPSICRYQYETVGQYVLSLLDPLLEQYSAIADQDVLSLLASGGDGFRAQLQTLEGHLAWLVYIVGSIIGGHSWASSQHRDGDELIDGDLCRRVLLLMQLVEKRLTNSHGQDKCSMYLELSLLAFCHNFRRSYIGEQHGMPDATNKSDASNLSVKSKIYLRMFQRMELGDHTVIVNMIVTKIGKNFQFWAQEEEVVNKTLVLFLDTTSGYSSAKLLMTLETVQYLMTHHTEECFPFLALPANTRHRTTFHGILSKLIFQNLDDNAELFDVFMAPILDVLARLGAASEHEFRQESVKHAVIGVCRDLRGIVDATHNRRTFSTLFEAIYPSVFPPLIRAAEVWFNDPSVTTAVLKFMTEFVYNKAQRIMFEQSSPNGILLFRETSSILVAYGSRILGHQPQGNEIYPQKYKGIALCLTVLAHALSKFHPFVTTHSLFTQVTCTGGNYVNFGVFALYEDPALDNALQVTLQLALAIPLADLMVRACR
jgi:exportin-7